MKSIFRSLFLLMFFAGSLYAEEVGKRPYELDWANRTKDAVDPILDFESDQKWTVESPAQIEANFQRSRKEQIWGDYVYRLSFRANESKPEVKKIIKIRSPKPIPVPAKEFDTVSFWIQGNYWGRGANTNHAVVPPAVDLIFQLPDGKEFRFPFTKIDWRNWYLVHRRFSENEIALLNRPGVCFNGMDITVGLQDEERDYYFDNFALYKEEFRPLKFSSRPRRGIDMFPGQSSGFNTGKDRLPFPNREETILPDSLCPGAKNTVRKIGSDSYEFLYSGPDGSLAIQYKPESGTWSDLSARWNGSDPFLIAEQGGVSKLSDQKKTEAVQSREKISVDLKGDTLISRWKYRSDSMEAEVEYHFQLKGKSLIADTFSKGGKAACVDFGNLAQVNDLQSILIPYLCEGGYGASRPTAILFLPGRSDKAKKEKLFIFGNVDWYRSNASRIADKNAIRAHSGSYRGGVLYLAKTDGKKNDLFERFFITISPKFEEILPTIPNPQSPYKAIAGKKLWRVHAANNREEDKKIWYYLWRHGIREVIINDHETQWREGGESFTFRTRTDPSKGGEEGQLDYTRFLREKLGYVYGPYNNFTDFATLNGYWNFDMVGRMETGQLQSAWMRCYGPKPIRGIEYCEKLTPILKKKFAFDTAYCDVHTSVVPWSRTDYDSRVPGAGTFAASYYAYGEIMLLQKKGWNGPVYSEGPNHYYYAGLTDGNYAQDQGYRFMDRPWLVDFDLLKIHDLECDFGMGSPGMFSPAKTREDKLFYLPDYPVKTDEGRDDFIDRFLAATLAFGHIGFLVADFCFDPPKTFGLAYGPPGKVCLDKGIAIAMRSYYMNQQIASRYTQSSVATIRYCDEKGRKYPTSDAIKSGIIDRNQLIVEYKDGTVVCVNGNKSESMIADLNGERFELPPNGYRAWTKDRSILVRAELQNGKRFDYCESPSYIYLDTRGANPQKLEKAAGTGIGVCRTLSNGQYEILLLKDSRIGFAIDASKAIAVDFQEKEIGPAKIKKENGFLYLEPVKGAFSYRVMP
ncbi:MAG: hypothetical protein Q4G69_09395 [Planctomycetia bacterium]|nr:hypothetical protein [Planctomycetia bacterium]